MNTRRFGSKKKLALAAVAGVTIFGGSYGLAASLSLTSDTLGAAEQVVAACQSGTMNVAYTPAFSATVPGYNATTVTITGIQSGCDSKNYRVTLFGAGGTSLGEATGTTSSSATSASASITAQASAVTGVAVVFEG